MMDAVDSQSDQHSLGTVGFVSRIGYHKKQ